MNTSGMELCGQFLKRQNGRSNHMPEGVNKQVRTLPAIEAKLHLCKVGREMLCADFVPRSDDATLEQREGRFNRVRVNVTDNVLLILVFNRFVLRCVLSG